MSVAAFYSDSDEYTRLYNSFLEFYFATLPDRSSNRLINVKKLSFVHANDNRCHCCSHYINSAHTFERRKLYCIACGKCYLNNLESTTHSSFLDGKSSEYHVNVSANYKVNDNYKDASDKKQCKKFRRRRRHTQCYYNRFAVGDNDDNDDDRRYSSASLLRQQILHADPIRDNNLHLSSAEQDGKI